MNGSHIHLQVYDVLKGDNVRKKARETKEGREKRKERKDRRRILGFLLSNFFFIL